MVPPNYLDAKVGGLGMLHGAPQRKPSLITTAPSSFYDGSKTTIKPKRHNNNCNNTVHAYSGLPWALMSTAMYFYCWQQNHGA